MKTLLFWQNTDFDADSELEGTILTIFESFRRYPAGLCFRHLKKSLNGPCLRVFHAIVSRNRAGLSARFLEYVPLRMYLVQLTSLRATIFSGRVFSWSVKILRSTDCHGHSEMAASPDSTHIWLWFHYIPLISDLLRNQSFDIVISDLFSGLYHIYRTTCQCLNPYSCAITILYTVQVTIYTTNLK